MPVVQQAPAQAPRGRSSSSSPPPPAPAAPAPPPAAAPAPPHRYRCRCRRWYPVPCGAAGPQPAGLAARTYPSAARVHAAADRHGIRRGASRSRCPIEPQSPQYPRLRLGRQPGLVSAAPARAATPDPGVHGRATTPARDRRSTTAAATTAAEAPARAAARASACWASAPAATSRSPTVGLPLSVA